MVRIDGSLMLERAPMIDEVVIVVETSIIMIFMLI